MGHAPEEPTRTGRAAAASDLPAVTGCLASAFFADPVWGAWAFPDPVGRRERLGRLMGFWARAALRNPWLRMTERAEAATVWIPPGVPELTGEEAAAFEVLLADLFGARSGELGQLFEQFDEHHPHEPHYYLSLWGTHRDHAGRGIGTRLLLESLRQIDEQRMPAYLESTNPANIGRYEALGFRRRSQFGAARGPVITTMWREALAPT